MARPNGSRRDDVAHVNACLMLRPSIAAHSLVDAKRLGARLSTIRATSGFAGLFALCGTHGGIAALVAMLAFRRALRRFCMGA